MKPRTPYQRLMRAACEYARRVNFPNKKTLWAYDKKDLVVSSYNLKSLHDSCKAATVLGYDTLLVSTERGLDVVFVEKSPGHPDLFDWSKT